MSERYKIAKARYEEAARRVAIEVDLPCGMSEPHDITGGFVFEEHGWALLRNPTKTQAAEFYEDLFEYALDSGWLQNGADKGYFPDWLNEDWYPEAEVSQ